jgi:hypothetical protein
MKNTVFYNGVIHTLNPSQPEPEALVIREGKVFTTGQIADFSDFTGHWVDLQGKTLLPGFFDAHLHLWKVGDLLTFNLDLRGVSSIEEIQDKLSVFSKHNPHLQWIRARGFNEAQMKEGRLPDRHDIDKVISNKPVFLQRTCAHIAVLNSKALEICNIHTGTPIPFGGEIRTEADGFPNGVLCETALGLAMHHFPKVTIEDYETMILAACRELLRQGITSVTDPAVMPDLLDVYIEMDRAGKLPMRIHAVPIVLPDGDTEPLPLPEPCESDHLVVNTVKFFADGGLSGQTAALSRPYKGMTSKGILRLNKEQFFGLALEAQERGLQVATHAIGDEAISLVLETYERLYRHNSSAPRHRIEHLGLPTKGHLDQIAALGLHIVTQPIFLKELGRNFRSFLDEDFLNDCYPVRSLLDRGVNVAFSTDAPVVKDLRPLSCITSAMLRHDQDKTSIAPQEEIGFAESLFCYTMGSACANRVENKTGSLSAGKDADLIVLDKSPFDTLPEQLEGIKVKRVWAKGKEILM